MIDLCAGGIFAAMFGDSSRVIWNAILDLEMEQYPVFCSYSPHRQDYWRDRYISMLKELTGFESVALFTTGSEATEAFWRCMRVYSGGKPGIWGGLPDPDDIGKSIARPDAMHGYTLGAMIMGGKLSWPSIGVNPNYPGLGAEKILMPQEATCGMIMEPYHAPSGQFHRVDPTINRLMERRKEFPDIALCIDEIQGGFGRTGKLWAHEHYQRDNKFLLSPDFVTIGKLCGGGLPLSALLGPKEIMEDSVVKAEAHLHSTHSGNPLMCAVGCKVIEEMQKQGLIDRSARLGEVMHEKLKDSSVRVHGKGLLAGIELRDNEEAGKVVALCLKREVQVCDTGRKWVKIGPALNIEEEKLMEGVKILMESVEEVVNERLPEAHGAGSEGSEAGSGISAEIGDAEVVSPPRDGNLEK